MSWSGLGPEPATRVWANCRPRSMQLGHPSCWCALLWLQDRPVIRVRLVACECTAGVARGKCASGTGGQLWHGGGWGGSSVWHLALVELQILGSGRGTGREQRGTQASGTGAKNEICRGPTWVSRRGASRRGPLQSRSLATVAATDSPRPSALF